MGTPYYLGLAALWIAILGVIARLLAVEHRLRWPLAALCCVIGLIASVAMLRSSVPAPANAIQNRIAAPESPPTSSETAAGPRRRAPRNTEAAREALTRISTVNNGDVAQFEAARSLFNKRRYNEARGSFEQLLKSNPTLSGEENMSGLIKFYIYLSLLVEGYASSNQMLSEFDLVGLNPSPYYARAAHEFKIGNYSKAYEWIDAAEKVYSKDLNMVFRDPFYELGWIIP